MTAEDIDARLEVAKRRISLACLACMRGAPDAYAQVAKALAEVDGARRALLALQTTAPTTGEPEVA